MANGGGGGEGGVDLVADRVCVLPEVQLQRGRNFIPVSAGDWLPSHGTSQPPCLHKEAMPLPAVSHRAHWSSSHCLRKHPFLRSGVWEAQSFWAECLLRLAVFPTGRQSPDLTVRRDNKLGGFCKLCSTCLQLEMVADPWGHLTGLGFIQ